MQSYVPDLPDTLEKELEKHLPENEHNLWIRPLSFSFKENSLLISAPNILHCEQFKQKYLSLVKKLLKKHSQLTEFKVVVNKSEMKLASPSHFSSVSYQSSKSESPASTGSLSFDINKSNTFDEFVVGPDNQMAYASCLAVSKEPSKQFNPLFLYGETGLGKTHLLQATYQFMQAEHRHLKIVYTNCEAFTNEFIHAINSHSLDVFRRSYRQVDVLIVDDIQFLADKKSTQEEFFHTFNDLISSLKQVIVSSDSSPGDLKKFENRLISRFSSGLVTGIDKPLYETRLAIIRHKCKILDLSVSSDIQQKLAEISIDNIREISGILITLNAHMKLNKSEINFNLIYKLFPQYYNVVKIKNKIIHFEDIVQSVTTHFNLRLQDLQSKKKPKSIAYPRQISMYLLRKLTDHSLEEIGAFFGGRDHSTVQYAQTKIEKLRLKDIELNSLLTYLENSILNSEVKPVNNY
jgi:chromosomal replication initiator protein